MSFFSKIKEFFIVLFASFIAGLVVGIMGGLCFMFVRYQPFIALGVAIFFSLFHLTALKTAWREKNYLTFFGRIVFVCVCAFAPASLVWIGFVTSYSDLKMDAIDTLAFAVLIAGFILVMGFIILVSKYFSETRFGKTVEATLRGAETITGLKDFFAGK